MPYDVCAICGEEIFDPKGMWCYGCKHYVCERHNGDPWGAHVLLDHDRTYWDGEEDE